jgi:hypothetical protein
MGLFGTMNWLYTWYNPRVDPGADVLAREFSDIFLQGIRCGNPPAGKTRTDGKTSGAPGRMLPRDSAATKPSRKLKDE